MTKTEREIAYHIASEAYDDLPDGAYFALMEEEGFDIEDHIAYSNNQPK